MRQSVIFANPYTIKIADEPVPKPGAGDVLVKTLVSAISPGTEMLAYRGQFPRHLSVDATIDGMEDAFRYPLRYGYAAVGQVQALGLNTATEWMDRRVFSFQPHSSHFIAKPEALVELPADISAERAAFLPHAETAVTFVLDGAPKLNERVAVFGQGIIGLMTTAILAGFPLERLVTIEGYERRRVTSRALGIEDCLMPEQTSSLTDFDLVYEVSGNPAALRAAIQVTGFDGRLVIGSWYGEKPATLDLGGHFHRSRMQLISSQVSTIDPELSGRWSKERRFAAAWDVLRRLDTGPFVTHRFPITEAADAYRLIDQRAEETIQVLLTY